MNILNLFEKKTNNQLNVLRNIHENEGVINIDKITKQTLLDSKTVNMVVQDIFEHLESDKNLKNIDTYLEIRSKIFQKSWIYKFLYRVILAKEITIVSFTIEFYISESKLRRKIKQINDILKPTDLKIISRNGFIEIKGLETQIRFFGQQFFWTIFKGCQWPFEELDFKKVYELFSNNIFNNKNIQIKTVTYVEWCYTFAINVIRFRHGKEIQEESLLKFDYLYSVLQSKNVYIQSIRESLHKDYYLSNNEQIYIFLLVQAKGQFYMNKNFFDQSIQFHKKNKTEIYIVYKEVLQFFTKKNRVLEKSALAIILSANTSATLIHGFSHTHSGYGVPSIFTKNAPHLIPKMESIIDSIKKKYPEISFLNQSIYLSVRYAEAYSLLNNMLDFEKKVRVLLMTDLPFATEELMAKQLKAIFFMRANIDFETLSNSDVDEYDLIIKTTIDIGKNSSYQNKLVIITPNLCDKDIQKIEREIKKISKNTE